MITSKPRRTRGLRHTPVLSVIALTAGALFAGTMLTSAASAQVLGYANEAPDQQWSRSDDALGGIDRQAAPEASRDVDVLPAALRRQVVDYNTAEAPGTVIIDTPHTVLYYVLGGHRAIRYGVGVGREGFTWAGVQTISRKAEWPDWFPPSEMIARQPYLPRFVAGGPGNPLGARAMYLGGSVYRIHGTNDPTTIGKFVSSGCIRMTNTDVQDLFGRVDVGTKVVVLPKSGHASVNPAPHVQSVTPRITAANLTGSALY
jgi:lipoprotein-anchoring transpeptidase ErfK/SrfK